MKESEYWRKKEEQAGKVLESLIESGSTHAATWFKIESDMHDRFLEARRIEELEEPDLDEIDPEVLAFEVIELIPYLMGSVGKRKRKMLRDAVNRIFWQDEEE